MKTQELMTGTGIPQSEVEIMVETFHAYEKLNPGFDPTMHVKCVWFPIDEITTFVKTLNDENADGLRIYFGRYPNDISKFIDPKPRPNTNSVILVSTQKGTNGIGKTDYFVPLDKAFLPVAPENRGEQCQPTCDGVTIDLPNI
jgi:hypothetical protein